MIRIELNQRDVQRIKSALRRVVLEIKKETKRLPFVMAVEYRNNLIANIVNQRYAGTYAAYNPRYAKWKNEFGGASGFWRLTGTLVNSLSTFPLRSGTEWFSGITPGSVNITSTSFFKNAAPRVVSVDKYARLNEYGGTFGDKTWPARPVFIPTFEDYKKTEVTVHGKRSLRRVGGKWY